MAKNGRGTLISGLIVVGAMLLTACGGGGSTDIGAQAARASDEPSEEFVEAAKDEGSIVWYSSIPQDQSVALSTAFSDKYGIDVELVRQGSEVVAPRFSAERDAGDADADIVTIPEDYILSQFNDNGWLEPVDPELMPAVQAWPEEHLHEDTYGLVNIQPLGVAYNTDMVDGDDLETWDDLVDEQFQDEIALADPDAIRAYTALFQILGEEYGDEYLEKFQDLNYQLVPSSVPATQDVAAGETAIALPSLYSLTQPLVEAGAPIEMKVLEPTTGVQQFLAMTEGSDAPNAQKLFMNFALSAEGQAVLNEDNAASVLENIPGTLELPENYVVPNLEEANEHREELAELMGY